MHGANHSGVSLAEGILLFPFVAAALIYLCAVATERAKGRTWPTFRTLCWLLAMVGIASSLLLPHGTRTANPFTTHATGHLIAGMVAPLLLVLAAPGTLALRSFSLVSARRLSSVIKSAPVRTITHPVFALVLNTGSLWVLYLTPLHELSAIPLFHVIFTLHFVVAGFIFTAAVLPVDPAPHRASLGTRLAVVAIAMFAHGVLAKAIFSAALGSQGLLSDSISLSGGAPEDFQRGAQLMYYGGDAVDLVLLGLIFAQAFFAGRTSVLSRSPRREIRRIGAPL